ncbi:MAG TPA: efflux RND transporter periplasmic adaptor subunit, partial [Micropepsaceae bacterium]|nr:efflux RND transporter periplasmic adaptor subunit [Micropepsaceae bacterium]
SKRQSAVYATPSKTGLPNPWLRRVLFAVLALGIGGYVAANPDIIDKIGALTTAGTAPQGGGRGAGRGGGGAAPPVRVATAEIRDVAMTARTLGTVLANAVVTIKPQVDGPLVDAMFKEGQIVRKGDLLFRIDPSPFESALRQAQATVARDQAQYASAQADADRGVMLADRGIVSAQQRDQLVATAKALAASIAADQAAVERAQLNLGYTTIRSPVDGKTGPFLVYPGNQVHANDATGLVTITQIQPVKIDFNLPQGDLPQLQDRMRENQLTVGVRVRKDAVAAEGTDQSDSEIPVKVDFIGNVVDDRTGTIELRATFQNPDLRLVPGELVDISVNLETLKQVVTVPHDALNVGQNVNYVFVVDKDNKAQMRQVRVLYQDQAIAALGSGVQAGDRVVTDGQLRLTPGVKVDILPGLGGAAAGANAQAQPAQDTAGAQDAAAQPSGRRGGG